MGLLDYVRVLRRRWAWVLASLVVVVAASAVWAASSPPSYASTETLFYTGAAQDSATDTRLNSYASLATSGRLVDAISQELALTEPTTTVARKITAKAEPNTLIVTVTARDRSAEGARRLASAAARQLVLLSNSLETAPGSDEQPAAGQSRGQLVPADAATSATAENAAPLMIGLGVVFGLVAGAVLALIREATDSRIRSPEQLHQLGVAQQTVVRIADASDDMPAGQVAEGYRVLRTVLFRGGHKQPTSIVVSSCDRGRHLPGVAAALAVTFARAATRVVLVSTDLRSAQPGAEWARAEPGLGNVLVKENTLADVIETAHQSDLWVLPAGGSLPYPEDSLASIAMADVVEQLRAAFDLVIMDALPLVVHADALSVAEATGAGVLLVVVEGKTRRQHVRAALGTLESLGTPVVAVALVRPPHKHLGRQPAHAATSSAARTAAVAPTPAIQPFTPPEPPAAADAPLTTDEMVAREEVVEVGPPAEREPTDTGPSAEPTDPQDTTTSPEPNEQARSPAPLRSLVPPAPPTLSPAADAPPRQA
jgi:Mrp family chromosome partitioning ATPase/capsular polysaccharide biosynthesis protein